MFYLCFLVYHFLFFLQYESSLLSDGLVYQYFPLSYQTVVMFRGDIYVFFSISFIIYLKTLT